MNTLYLWCLILLAVKSYCQVLTGAEQPELYLNQIKDKRIGLVVNQTSMMKDIHLVDFLKSKGNNITYVFAPEHGFRGNADAGEHLKDYVDEKTGIKVISLFGEKKKPSPQEMAELDVLIFDIQDVGVRFYTYISTLHNIIEACVEHKKSLIILDRPNPNGMFVDGPVLDLKYKSFVGMHPIPVLHGLTVGELAKMILGENWVVNKDFDLNVIPCKNYAHQTKYPLPVKPSPNLPNQKSIEWYASLCFFEGTPISLARGTMFPFQAIGYPDPVFGTFCFEPKSIEGMSKNPPHLGKKCFGIDLRNETPENGFTLKYLIQFYDKFPEKSKFFQISFFDKLAGTDQLRRDIMSGKSENEIKLTWQKDLEAYKLLRKKYLLYKE
ncbi:MAG: DUF1343 domain-containing protein [Cytophagales bacterium]